MSFFYSFFGQIEVSFTKKGEFFAPFHKRTFALYIYICGTNLKHIDIMLFDFSNIKNIVEGVELINPNWSLLGQLDNLFLLRKIKGESKVSVSNKRYEEQYKRKDSNYQDINRLTDDPVTVESIRIEKYIKHPDGVMVYNGFYMASNNYELMMNIALIKLMFAQNIRYTEFKNINNNKVCGLPGYIYLDKNAVSFIVDIFNMNFENKSYLNLDSKSRRKRINKVINDFMDYGYIKQVKRIDGSSVVDFVGMYSLNMFMCYSGEQIDRISYEIIKREMEQFVLNNPSINLNDHISINQSKIENSKININDLECVDVYLVTIIKTYKQQLSFTLENGLAEGTKFNISLLARGHGCTRKLFSGKIKDLVKNEDLIETRKGYYILNPERYCV